MARAGTVADIAVPRRNLLPRLDRLWIAPPLLILVVLFLYPLGLIIRQSLGDSGTVSLSTFAEVVASRQFHEGLLHTVVIALGSTAGCLVLGFVFSLIIAFVPFPGAKAASRLIDTFIALPTFLVTLAFTFIYGSAGLINASLMRALNLDLPPLDFLYTQWGVILAETTVYTPFVMRPLLKRVLAPDEQAALALPVSAELPPGPPPAPEQAEEEQPPPPPPAWISNARNLGAAQQQSLKTVGQLVEENPKQAALIVRDWLMSGA